MRLNFLLDNANNSVNEASSTNNDGNQAKCTEVRILDPRQDTKKNAILLTLLPKLKVNNKCY